MCSVFGVECFAPLNSALSDLVYPTSLLESGWGQIALVCGLCSNQQLNRGVQPHVVPSSHSSQVSLSLHQLANGRLISSPFVVVSHFSRTHFPRRLNILSVSASHFPLSLYPPSSHLSFFLAHTPSLFPFSFDAGGWHVQLTSSFSSFSPCYINPGHWMKIQTILLALYVPNAQSLFFFISESLFLMWCDLCCFHDLAMFSIA